MLGQNGTSLLVLAVILEPDHLRKRTFASVGTLLHTLIMFNLTFILNNIPLYKMSLILTPVRLRFDLDDLFVNYYGFIF